VSVSSGGPSFSFDGGLIATEDNAYVEYQDQAYELGTDAFAEFKRAYAVSARQNQGQGEEDNVFSRFGVDPKTWLTNVSNEGTTDVEGTEAIQIHGDADIAKIVEDLQKVQEQTGSTTQQLTPEQIDQLTSSVESASIDVYSGVDDHLLRRLAVSLEITPPEGTGEISSANVDFSVTLSDVNQAQTISAPSNPKPISDLLSQLGIPGIPGLDSGGFTLPQGGSSSGSGSATSPAYLECVQQATSASEINDCAQELQ
jgi:hypothetical protein